MHVLMICPTGQLVYNFKCSLPEMPGIENVVVDTLHGVLKYQRPGSDRKVVWTPPTALRKFDVIFVDEASQYTDTEWDRLYMSVRQLPHAPYMVIVADFQQLQPIGAGTHCRNFCENPQFCDRVQLDTVYRSSDPEHLLFQNRIREKQPTREMLVEYFADRHWSTTRRAGIPLSLMEAVQRGIEIGRQYDRPFTWLTVTNKGSEEVCEAALSLMGVTEEELATGYYPDPSGKVSLRIVAKKGLVIRLTRNLDKQRGFVNGATAVVYESLRGNAVFVARLIGTGNLVLVHPMQENGVRFLPCCYGYATTIRRAQGASLDCGCLYFNQPHFHAARGYGYVGVSRFRSRAGCYLFGCLRRSDFLPVGPDLDDEVWERGPDSEDSDEEDIMGVGIFGGASDESDEGFGDDAGELRDTSDLGIDIDFM